jgi:hypothetical protein
MSEASGLTRRLALTRLGGAAGVLALAPLSAFAASLSGVEARTLSMFKRAYPDLIHSVEEEGQRKFVIAGESRSKIPLEDGVQGKSFEQRLEDPDLIESVEDSYPLELNRKAWPLNYDPGRLRTDAFFRAVYGATEKAVAANLVEVDFCGHRVSFNRRNGAADALGRAGRKIAALVAKDPKLQPYVKTLGGTFAWRTIEGTSRLSAHCFAVSIDLNPELGGYWRWSKGSDLGDMKRRVAYPDSIVKAFESEGFVWGGKWYHFDLMHFEYRPEFFG